MGLDITVQKIVSKPVEDYRYISLIDNDGNYENRFPEWTKKYELLKTEKWYDWEKFKFETGIDVKNSIWLGEEYGPNGSIMTIWPKDIHKPEIEEFALGDGKYDWKAFDKKRNEHKIVVDLEKVPTYEKEIKVLYWEEVGYQRKGFNSQFYEDYRNHKIGYYVWNKSDLERYKEDYCADDESKEHFQKYVIDPFIEGECCVTFDW